MMMPTLTPARSWCHDPDQEACGISFSNLLTFRPIQPRSLPSSCCAWAWPPCCSGTWPPSCCWPGPASPGHCLVVAVLELDPTHPLLQHHDVTGCLWSYPVHCIAAVAATIGAASCWWLKLLSWVPRHRRHNGPNIDTWDARLRD